MSKKLIILGIRGVPASHGGFETFAENLCGYLVKRGWGVIVYCQESAPDYMDMFESEWNGVRRIHIPVKGNGAKATVTFDYLSVKHAVKQSGIVLTLGYNTAIFNLIFRIKRKINIINMDGIEWKRDKWRWYERFWLYINERAGCLIGNHLIADHPEIEKHLLTRIKPNKVTMIPYGARDVDSPSEERLDKFALTAGGYAIVIARAEPENSILEIVMAFSSVTRHKKLVVLGKYDENNNYHSLVKSSASAEVIFLGAVYDHDDLDALRLYSLFYIHGHTVGGTNPSLIEALGAGQPVLANDNVFNRWVAGDGAMYFKDEDQCASAIDVLLNDKCRLQRMRIGSKERFETCFTWNNVLGQYDSLLQDFFS